MECAEKTARQVDSEPADSIFSHEQWQASNVSWWQRNFLLTKPALFGTWDGVFTTVLVNIFGVIVFLRMGWIVGTAGILHAIILLAVCAALALITIISAIGICERCQIQSGGIYFLVSHVLGGQIGGAVGLMYAFGQSVAAALVAVGFGESVARMLNVEDTYVEKFIAITVLVLLAAINAAGVRWIIRLQLLLLAFLVAAVIDFFLGALFTIDEENGVDHITANQFGLNLNGVYEGMNCSSIGFDVPSDQQSFFSVFGVFFANFLGVLAGVNMSNDLKDPHRNIPLGELSAIGTSTSTCFLFIIVLGSKVDRAHLICDSLISERVSLTGVLFLTGLYVSSLSSTVGSMLGTPRVIQSIASEEIIPILNPFAIGVGPNKNPVRASVLMMTIAVLFVLTGNLNKLAVLSTMPFMITYAFVDYSYVSLAMSYDLQSVNTASERLTHDQSYGSIGNIESTSGDTKDLNALFLNRNQHFADDHASIIGQPRSWYSLLCNRYVSFIGAIINLLILVFINAWYAVMHFIALAVLYVYIGRVCPSVFPGISQFSLPHMFKTAFSSTESIPPISNFIIMDRREKPSVETSTLNEDNRDFIDRKRYHHSEQQTGPLQDID